MKKFIFNEEQLKWLCTIVRYRLEDELSEKDDLRNCHLNEDSLKRNQLRIDMWKSIYKELTKDGEYDTIR